jgi:hypothetical protein
MGHMDPEGHNMDTIVLEHRIEELHHRAAALQAELFQTQQELHAALAALEPEAFVHAGEVVTKAKPQLQALSTSLRAVLTHSAYKQAQLQEIDHQQTSKVRP